MARLPTIETRPDLYTGTPTPVANPLRGVAEGVGAFVAGAQDVIRASQEREATAFASEATANLQWQALEDFNTLQNTGDVNKLPEQFTEQYKKRSEDIIKNAPNDLAKQLMKERSDSIYRGMADNVLGFQAAERTRLQAISLDNAVNSYAQTAAKYPEQIPAILQSIDSDARNATSAMTPSQAIGYRQKAINDVLGVAIGTQADTNPVAAAKMLEEYGANLDADLNMRLRDNISKSQEKITGLLRTDSAEWVQRTAGNVPPDASIELQRKAGVPDVSLRVVTKPQAAQDVATINSMKNADEYIAFMQQVQQMYGENLDIYNKNIQQAGLKSDMRFSMLFDPLVDNEQLRNHFEVIKEGSDKVRELTKAKLAANNESMKDIEASVSEKIEGLFVAQMQSGLPVGIVESTLTNIMDMASLYYSKGNSIDDAAEKATKWLTDQFIIEDIGNNKVFIPNTPEYDAGDIIDAVEYNIRQLKADDVSLEFNNIKQSVYTDADTYVKSIKDNGGAVTNITGDGVYITDSIGNLVFGNDGKPIQYKFTDLNEQWKSRLEDIQKLKSVK